MARKTRSEEKEARRFAAILVVLLSALGGWSLFRGHGGRAYGFFGTAAVALVLPLVAFAVWMKLFRIWMKFAEGLSWVMTRVILSTFFYLILTPVGLVLRLLGKGPLDMRWKDGRPSYWVDKPEGEYTLERYAKRY